MLNINKKNKRILIILLATVLISGCQMVNKNTVKYTRDYIQNKGVDNITWDDFDYLEHEDIGSGIRIEKYQLIDGELLLYGIGDTLGKIVIIQGTEEQIIKDWD